MINVTKLHRAFKSYFLIYQYLLMFSLNKMGENIKHFQSCCYFLKFNIHNWNFAWQWQIKMKKSGHILGVSGKPWEEEASTWRRKGFDFLLSSPQTQKGSDPIKRDERKPLQRLTESRKRHQNLESEQGAAVWEAIAPPFGAVLFQIAAAFSQTQTTGTSRFDPVSIQFTGKPRTQTSKDLEYCLKFSKIPGVNCHNKQ